MISKFATIKVLVSIQIRKERRVFIKLCEQKFEIVLYQINLSFDKNMQGY
jgi:hypothetical protein